jgi:hypothetical protein
MLLDEEDKVDKGASEEEFVKRTMESIQNAFKKLDESPVFFGMTSTRPSRRLERSAGPLCRVSQAQIHYYFIYLQLEMARETSPSLKRDAGDERELVLCSVTESTRKFHEAHGIALAGMQSVTRI